MVSPTKFYAGAAIFKAITPVNSPRLRRKNPARATKVLKELDSSNGSRAAGYAIDSMSDSVAPAVILELFRDVVMRNFDNVEFRGSMSRAVEKLLNRAVFIEDDIVAVLEGWATLEFCWRWRDR